MNQIKIDEVTSSMSYHIVVIRLILNLAVLFAILESFSLANELFGKMPIIIIVLAALSSSEIFRAMFEEIIMVCKPIITCFEWAIFKLEIVGKVFALDPYVFVLN